MNEFLAHIRRIIGAFRFSAFRALYWGTAIATFRHSAIGFATVESGSLLWGALSAIAVDIAMLLAAERLQRERNAWLVGGLVIACVASVFSQALYMVSHAATVSVAPGAEWLNGYGQLAQWLIDLRVVVIPFLLPLQVVVFSLASKSTALQSVAEQPLSIAGRCKAIYAVAPDADYREVAAIVGCSPSTASRARGKGKHRR